MPGAAEAPGLARRAAARRDQGVLDAEAPGRDDMDDLEPVVQNEGVGASGLNEGAEVRPAGDPGRHAGGGADGVDERHAHTARTVSTARCSPSQMI